MTRSKRHQRLESDIGLFVRQYGRKMQKSREPNDRRHDRKLEPLLRRMKPGELGELMHGGEPDGKD